jgi:hypothetical protein
VKTAVADAPAPVLESFLPPCAVRHPAADPPHHRSGSGRPVQEAVQQVEHARTMAARQWDR